MTTKNNAMALKIANGIQVDGDEDGLPFGAELVADVEGAEGENLPPLDSVDPSLEPEFLVQHVPLDVCREEDANRQPEEHRPQAEVRAEESPAAA